MNGKWKLFWKNTFLSVSLTIILTTFIHIFFMEGMFLLGLPRMDKVERVQISYQVKSDEVKILTDERDIELACKLANFLKYVPFKEADESREPLITITYECSDGTSRSVSANNETVWWKGKAHALKQDEIFVNLTEGIFFLAEAAEQ